MRTLYALKVDIVPEGSVIPLVSHVFYGDSAEQVDDALTGHLGHDVFLSECHATGTFDGSRFNIVKRLVKKEIEK
jgi:hypothetical protein